MNGELAFPTPASGRFLRRYFWISLFFLCAGIALSGYVVLLPEYQKPNGGVESLVPVRFSLGTNALEAGFLQWSRTIDTVARFPLWCANKEWVNELQQKQCGLLIQQTLAWVIIAVIPWVVWAVSWLFALDFYKGQYRKTRRRINKGKAVGIGNVRQEIVVSLDWRVFLLGYRAYWVEQSLEQSGKAGTRSRMIKVYFSSETEQPVKDQGVALFSAQSKNFGSAPFYGIIYSPFVSIRSARV